MPALPSSSFAPSLTLRSTSRGFSLVELLVVVAVIAILAGVVLQTAGYVQRRGATARAEAEIKALEAALESYKADFGDYPPGTTSVVLREALSPETGKVYFEFSKRMAPRGTETVTASTPVVDPFGQPYGYTYPGVETRNGTAFFDLWSTAGGSDEAAWVKNW